MSVKYEAVASSMPNNIPDFYSKRTPFYMNPKERHFMQEVLNVNWYILGTSMFVVIFVGMVLGVHSSFSMSRIGIDGAPVHEEGNVCLTFPIMLVGWIVGNVTFFCIGKMKDMQTGAITWSYEIGQRLLLSVEWPVWLKAAILVFSPVMVVAYLSDITFVTFYNLELPTMTVCFIVGICMMVKPRKDFLLKEGAIDNATKADALTRRHLVRRASQAALTIVHEPTTTQNKQRGIKVSFSVMTTLLTFLGYPFTVLTVFRSFGVGGRMAIVLLFHPLIMEFLMHGYRASTGVGTNLLGEKVKVEPMRDLMSVFIMESYLVLIRRIMLCNLGSFQATTIAIIVTGIEETAVRSTIDVSERAKRAHAIPHLKPTQSTPTPPPPFTATRHLVPRVLPQQAPSHPRRDGRPEGGLGGLHLQFHAR